MKPKRIQRKRTKGWRKPAGAVCVSRPNKWGNLFKVGDKLGSVPHWIVRQAGYWQECAERVICAWMAKDLYRVWVMRKIERGLLDIAELRGKDLVCWCALDAPCHVDVLLELANAP